ncbi:uncharacterized protein LOC128635736 [Bombina bombina]|uniref:uncharacterized protein LOC128635736 n=1 Tax=Bombina bombina TaxID=8345 RepID=UPI00235AB1AB|nr:uncharacterized protein LOC128635736 [Bombina bombina]
MGIMQIFPSDKSGSKDQRFSSLVPVTGSPFLGNVFPQASVGYSDDGRQPTGLGCSLEFPESTGFVDSGGGPPTNKYSGIKSDIQCSSGVASAGFGRIHQISVGQQHDCSLHQSSGGIKEFLGDDGSVQDNPMGRDSLLPSISDLYPRGRELGGRFFKSSDISSGGVGAPSGGVCSTGTAMGHTRIGSDGVLSERQTSLLRIQVQGSSGSTDRCSSSTLVVQPGLCVSTFPSPSTSDCQNQTGESFGGFDSACVTTQELVCRPSGHVISATVDSAIVTGPSVLRSVQASKSNFSATDCLEIERLILSKRGFSESVIDSGSKACHQENLS